MKAGFHGPSFVFGDAVSKYSNRFAWRFFVVCGVLAPHFHGRRHEVTYLDDMRLCLAGWWVFPSCRILFANHPQHFSLRQPLVSHRQLPIIKLRHSSDLPRNILCSHLVMKSRPITYLLFNKLYDRPFQQLKTKVQ